MNQKNSFSPFEEFIVTPFDIKILVLLVLSFLAIAFIYHFSSSLFSI